MLVPQQAVADDVAIDDVPASDAEPTPPTPPCTTTPPPPPHELPSISQVTTPQPLSPIAPPSSPPQQQQPSQPTTISIDLLHTLLKTCTTLTKRVENLEQDKIAQALEITKLKQRVKKLERKNKLKVSGLRRLKKVGTTQRVESSVDIEVDDAKDAEVEKNADDDESEPANLQEVIKVVTTARLMTEVVTAATTIITAAPSATTRRKGVVLRDPKETATSSTIVHFKPKSKDKEKGIMVQETKPPKKQAHIEQDEAYARELDADLNKNKNWDDVIEQFEEEESRALKRKTKSSEEKAVKKQKLNEEVEELKKHLQIVPNDDDDVYTEATLLALKVPVVDYEIHSENSKPYYMIIRADGSHQLFLSFLSLLRNFDREDLEVLCLGLEESKRRSWFSKSQKLETIRVLWSAYHNIYNYTDDLAGKEKISINKVHSRSNAQQSLELMLLKTSRLYAKGLLLLVEDLLLLVQVKAVG
nr:hypothetical protein [Tanacetum cinerariifolium]